MASDSTNSIVLLQKVGSGRNLTLARRRLRWQQTWLDNQGPTSIEPATTKENNRRTRTLNPGQRLVRALIS